MRYYLKNISLDTLSFGGGSVLPDAEYTIFDASEYTDQNVYNIANDSANIRSYFTDLKLEYYNDLDLKTQQDFWDDLVGFLDLKHHTQFGSEIYSLPASLGTWASLTKRVSIAEGIVAPVVTLSDIDYNNTQNLSVTQVTRKFFDVSFEFRNPEGAQGLCSVSFDWKAAYSGSTQEYAACSRNRSLFQIQNPLQELNLTLNETYNIGESNIGQVKPGTQLSTWGTAFMSSCNAPAHRICLYVTDADLTCTIQGSLYNASLSKIISSDAESTLANGLLTLEFTEPVSLVAGTLYYIAIAVDGDTALLGKTVDIESTQAPILNFVELGAALPVTLTPSNSATMLWMRIS